MGFSRRVLAVGNYCHDVLIRDDLVVAESLGGAASFISNIFTHLLIDCQYISKVGSDFKYSVFNPPIVCPSSRTTLFHAHFSSKCPLLGGHPGSDRILKRVIACDPIWPRDLPESGRFDFGMAVGVGGEILPETLERLVEICDVVFVDIQGLIREFDKNDGTVRLVELKDTKFYHLLSRIGFLKASAEEAEYMDVEEVRKLCCVVVTYGENGCKVYWKDVEVEISPFVANQIDPTGAGDSLLGGFVAGLAHGLAVPDAALLGNLFGSLTVAQIGLPEFDHDLLQRVKDEMQRRITRFTQHHVVNRDELWFAKPLEHDQFHESLSAVRQASALPERQCQQDQRDLHNHASDALNHIINHQDQRDLHNHASNAMNHSINHQDQRDLHNHASNAVNHSINHLDQQDLHNHASNAVNHNINHQSNGQTLLRNSEHNEPIEPVGGTPSHTRRPA